MSRIRDFRAAAGGPAPEQFATESAPKRPSSVRRFFRAILVFTGARGLIQLVLSVAVFAIVTTDPAAFEDPASVIPGWFDVAVGIFLTLLCGVIAVQSYGVAMLGRWSRVLAWVGVLFWVLFALAWAFLALDWH